MTWAAAGAAKPNVKGAVSTFTLAPSGAGNLMLVAVDNNSNSTVYCTGLSSSNVTWTPIGSQANSGVASYVTLFWGLVTAASSATVTASWSGTAPASIVFTGQEFSSSAGSWTVETFTTKNAASNTWPSLTPAANGELYHGYCVDGGTASAGSTPGYTYLVDNGGNGQAYNLNCAAGVATAPVWGDSAQTCGVMALLAESTSITVHPDAAEADGNACDPAVPSSTAPLYAGSASGASWAGTAGAVGGTQGDYATWTDSAPGSSATLELAAFGADAAVPAGSEVLSVTCTVRHGETPAAAVASVTAQACSGTTPVGDPQPLTAADGVHEDTVTFTGLAWADLADLRVRVTVTRN